MHPCGEPSLPAAEPLLIDVGECGDSNVVTVAGELDYPAAPRLRGALVGALTRLDGRPLVLDLTGVSFLGSAGLAAVLEGATAAGEQHAAGFRAFRIVINKNRPVTRSLAASGLDQILQLYPTMDDALADRR